MIGLYVKEPMQLETREIDEPAAVGDHEVRVEPIYGGICGSDIKIYQGKLSHATYPRLIGHEIVGRITEVGKAVDLTVGSRVIIQPNFFCGKCEPCRKGKRNICSNKQTFGVTIDGGLSHSFIIPSDYVFPVPDSLPDEKAVLVEPFAVVVHALKKVKISRGTSIGIVGCGTEGMLAAILADQLEASITAVDINGSKLEALKGILPNIRTKKPEHVNEVFDIVIEAAGTKKAIENSFYLAKPGGSVITLGLTSEDILYPATHIVRNEISVHGSIIYEHPHDITEAIERLNAININLEPIVTTYHIKDFNKAFDEAITGNYAKVMLNFTK